MTYNNPANPMHGWDLVTRETGLIEAMCPHGVGHPIPESSIHMDKKLKQAPGTWSTHGCDGCCREKIIT